jgi:hypothetical protein
LTLLHLPVEVDFGVGQDDMAIATLVLKAIEHGYKVVRAQKVDVDNPYLSAVLLLEDGETCSLVWRALHSEEAAAPLAGDVPAEYRLGARGTTPAEKRLITINPKNPRLQFAVEDASDPAQLIARWRAHAKVEDLATDVFVEGTSRNHIGFVFMKDGGVWSLWFSDDTSELYTVALRPGHFMVAWQNRAAGRLL